MYIINTTFVVEPKIHNQWYKFFIEKFIPAIQQQNFQIIALTRILAENNTGNYAYSLQITVDQIPEYQRYMQEPLEEYVEMAKSLFGEEALHFTTLLKKIPLD